MSTIKISQLPLAATINANTSNTVFAGVDIPSQTTFRMSAHAIAQGLYSNEILNVGAIQQNLPNTIAQFSAAADGYVQTNLVNINDGGTADIVITANTGSGGTDSANFIDMGYANKFYQPGLEYNNISTAINPLDGYLYVQGTPGANGGNLTIGTTTTGTQLRFMVGGGQAQNVVVKMTYSGLSMNTGTSITFGDGTTQRTAAASNSYSQAAFALANTGNSSITTLNSQVGVLQSNVSTIQTQALIFNAQITSSQANTVVTQGVDATQNTWISSNSAFSQAAFAQANSASANTILLSGINTTQNTWISSNSAFTQASFLKANNALANTNGVITAGDITISGNIQVLGVGAAGLFTINAVPYVANTPAFKITGSANTGYSQSPLNQGYMMQITGFANTSSRIVNDAFGANSYPVYVGRSARGSAVSPLATANGDILLRLSGNGWSNNFSQFGQSRIDFVAAENFTDTTKGTQLQFWNTRIGSNTLSQIAVFNGETATFVGNVNPAKGFIYTPLVYPAAQTAITIDFANNSVLRAQTSTGLVVSMTNYTIGKVVELWITNTAGTNQTYTSGVSAINSTINATTYSIPGTSTICARYFCVDGTLANTLVSVIHA